MTSEGETLIVESPGHWNLEAGPDFLNAVLLVGPQRRRLEGDVEIHVRPDDWKHHGHAGDPRYSRVVAHITYFPGPLPDDALPSGTVQCALNAPLRCDPSFSFENVDTTAYPYATHGSTPRRCGRLMAARTPDDQIAILESAGEARMRTKAERIALALDQRPAEEVFYAEFMCALGYKHNRAPFRQIASTVPSQQLRHTPPGGPFDAYALLVGVSALLPPTTSRTWDHDTNAFVRSLWDHWWKIRERWEPRAMERSAWTLTNQRPHNHPLRRLAAAASLFTDHDSLYDTVRSFPTESPRGWLRDVRRHIDSHSGKISFWNRHLALGGKRTARPVALIGKSRIASIVTNLVVPMLAAEEKNVSNLIQVLPPDENNSLIRQAAHSLFGPDHNPALYRTGLRQQGLLQIFHDFCLDSTTDCAECALADALERSTASPS